jgi:hypothetical protein
LPPTFNNWFEYVLSVRNFWPKLATNSIVLENDLPGFLIVLLVHLFLEIQSMILCIIHLALLEHELVPKTSLGKSLQLAYLLVLGSLNGRLVITHDVVPCLCHRHLTFSHLHNVIIFSRQLDTLMIKLMKVVSRSNRQGLHHRGGRPLFGDQRTCLIFKTVIFKPSLGGTDLYKLLALLGGQLTKPHWIVHAATCD